MGKPKTARKRRGKLMAIAIKSIPVLERKDARRFIKDAEETYRNRSNAIDVTEQVREMRKIMAKAKIAK